MFTKKVTDFRKKNTKRKISQETKCEINNRDHYCIICFHGEIQQYHHCWYGLQQQLDEGRNNPDRIVGLCNKCHNDLHFKGDNSYRQDCIDYLNKIYE